MTLTTWTDDFSDASIDSAKWGTATAGSGSVSESGTQIAANAPATADAACLYWKDQVRDSGWWQVFEARLTPSSVSGFAFLLGMTDGTSNYAAAAATFNADRRAAIYFESSNGLALTYFNGATLNWWNPASGGSWTTTTTYAHGDTTQGVTYIVRLRVRDAQFCLELAKGDGTAIIACTDWVNFSALTAYTTLDVFHGEVYTDFYDGQLTLDNASFQERDTSPVVGVYNGADSSGNYQIGTCYSLDADRITTVGTARFYRQQSAPTLAPPAGHTYVKDGYIFDAGGTTTMVYSAFNTASSNWRIRYATTSDSGDTWTDQGEVCGPSGAGWRQNGCQFPVCFHDGSNYHLYTGGYNGSSQLQIGYLTGSSLATMSEGGSNPVVALGTGGSWNDNGNIPFHVDTRGSTYHLFGGGHDGSAWQGGHWSSASKDSGWAEVGSQPELPRQSGNATTLSANASAGATSLSVNDESPFSAEDPIAISDASGNREPNRVKSTAAGSLALWSPIGNSYLAGDDVELYDQPDLTFATAGTEYAIATSFLFAAPGTGLIETLSMWQADGAGGWTLLPTQTPPLEMGGIAGSGRWDAVSSENIATLGDIFHGAFSFTRQRITNLPHLRM